MTPQFRQECRRFLSAIREGLVTSGAAAVSHEERAVATAVRARQVRPRRIAVIGSTGGAGTTTVAVLLASVLSSARDDQTLVLTTHGDVCDAAVRLAVPHAPRVTDVLAGLRRHGRIPPTPVTGSGLRVLAAPPPGVTIEPVLGALVDAAVSGHTCVVVDAGVAGGIADLGTLADIVDTVVLVSANSIDAVAATHVVLARWRAQTAGRAGATRLILAPVRIRPRGRDAGPDPAQHPSGTGTGTGPGTGTGEITASGLPHDRELARGTALDLSRLSGRTLTGMLTLAADVMGRH